MPTPPNKVRWGVLSTAKIGRVQVVPAMQDSELCEVTAIASRSLEKARQVADSLGIDKAYGSYDELLADPEIDVVYNPLPNHLHVPVSIDALRAGKHVLCEKPIALSSDEARRLVEASREHPRLKLMEAFMYRFHPQWERVLGWIAEGAIGELREAHARFSYFNDDPQNIRNQAPLGGGGLMDIGCYPISLARFVYGHEPSRALARVELDPRFQTDRSASAILEFDSGVATFTCGTQMAPHQRALLVGTTGRIEVEWPFNPPRDAPTRLWLDRGDGPEEFTLPACDKYAIQGDRFSRAVLDDTPVPTPIEDAVANMLVIEAVRLSGASGGWATV